MNIFLFNFKSVILKILQNNTKCLTSIYCLNIKSCSSFNTYVMVFCTPVKWGTIGLLLPSLWTDAMWNLIFSSSTYHTPVGALTHKPLNETLLHHKLTVFPSIFVKTHSYSGWMNKSNVEFYLLLNNIPTNPAWAQTHGPWNTWWIMSLQP